MSEHDCGGWCSKPGNAAVVAATLTGQKRTETARALGRPLTSVVTVVSRARALGCLPPVRQRGRPKVKPCGYCREDFTYYHNGTHYCSVECCLAARRLGVRVTEKDDPRELGPAEPPIPTDVSGMRRRALEAARDDVSETDMLQRFPDWMVDEALAKAIALGLRATGRHALRDLPLGPPP